MSLQYYTFYLRNGQRKVFLGADPQDAYTNNQTYSDGQQAIAYQEEGITLNYIWDQEHDGWVLAEPLKLFYKDFSPFTDDLVTQLIIALVTYNTIVMEFNNKCQLALSVEWGNFSFGWTHYIKVCYLEYHEGSYSENLKTDYHYLMTASEYFSPQKGNTAVRTFVNRILSGKPWNISTEKSQTLQEIYNEQMPTAMYDSNMHEWEKVWLLGSLIKRVECHNDIQDIVVNKFISSSIARDEHHELCMLLDQISCYCDEVLITKSGQRYTYAEELLAKHFGYHFTVGEQDRFGVLSMVINTNAGKLVYG